MAVSCTSAYTRLRPVTAADLLSMCILEAIHSQRPFYGSLNLCVELQHRGYLGAETSLAPATADETAGDLSPTTAQSAREETQNLPLLTEGLSIECPDQVWESNICYVPMVKKLFDLKVIMDWYFRRELAW